MSATDYLRLNEHKIFKELCESLPKNITKTLNLLTVRDSVLFTWDFQNNYVMSLNIKAARSREGDNVIHQKLLPLCPPLFSPEFLVANESGTLLAVAGPNGVLVMQLPMRYPPYGAFENNKEVVYCRSHSLDERLLVCSETVEVRQVKFHPGGMNDNHILVLTSDNMLRLYQVENNEARSISVYSVGEKPVGVFPGSKTPFLDLYGEIAVDFDFGLPEILESNLVYDFEDNKNTATKFNDLESKSLIHVQTQTPEKIIPKEFTNSSKTHGRSKWSDLTWPVYVLRGDGSIYSINVDLNRNKSKAILRGPLPISSLDADQGEACSLICLSSSPQIFCVAFSNGTICHSVLLDIEKDTYAKIKEQSTNISSVPLKELVVFESVELELGLPTSEEDYETKYKCPIYLHKDESKVGRYFATHSAGVHSVTISCVEELQGFVNGPEDGDPTSDIFSRPSVVEYLVCTKTTSMDKANSVIGFSVYHEPTSIIALLSDGSLVTLGILYASVLPKTEDVSVVEDEVVNSPLKKMLKEPFDQFIQKILMKASTHPVLKLPAAANQSQEQCYELLQRAAQVFREEHFKHHTKAREELEKRTQTLIMLKKNQQKEVEWMNGEKDVLREKAANLAEKYEDIKDKQDELLKKCENLLMLVSRKKCEPSDAEKEFVAELNVASEKVAAYGRVIDKIKSKLKYQQVQMENWRAQEVKKVAAINETHTNTIKTNLQETTKKISDMLKEVNEYKKMLNL